MTGRSIIWNSKISREPTIAKYHWASRNRNVELAGKRRSSGGIPEDCATRGSRRCLDFVGGFDRAETTFLLGDPRKIEEEVRVCAHPRTIIGTGG